MLYIVGLSIIVTIKRLFLAKILQLFWRVRLILLGNYRWDTLDHSVGVSYIFLNDDVEICGLPELKVKWICIFSVAIFWRLAYIFFLCTRFRENKLDLTISVCGFAMHGCKIESNYIFAMTLFRHQQKVHCNSEFCELWRFCGSNMNRHFFNADWACARSVCKCGTDASTVFLRTQCLADFKMKWMRPFIETCINLFCSSFSQIASVPCRNHGSCCDW